MLLNLLETSCFVLILVGTVSKIVLHQYLDYKHNRSVNISPSITFLWPMFVPYTEVVKFQYRRLRQTANTLLIMAGLALVAYAVVKLLIYLD